MGAMQVAESAGPDPAVVLAELVGGERVASDPDTLARFSRDHWPLAILLEGAGRPADRPACVVRPRHAGDVAAVLRWASETGVWVIPYGGGSGVCGGAGGVRGAVVLDLRSLGRILEPDRDALLVRAEAGVLWADLERQLTERGFTTGHYPQSIDLATVGGLVATGSSGQFSTGYGSIEDRVAGLEVVLADGTVLDLPDRAPRRAVGPELMRLFIGSEGVLGVITAASLRVLPLPASRSVYSHAFPRWEAGVEAIRRVLQAGWRPVLTRLYDPLDAARSFPEHAPPGRAVMLWASEGPAERVRAEREAVDALSRDLGATELGPDPVVHWLEHRNDVQLWYDALAMGVLVDTIEVAANWGRVDALYAAVRAAIEGVAGVFYVACHASHAYPQGTSLYFTLAARPAEPDPDGIETLYYGVWEAAMEACVAAGGTISHHHGVGRVRRRWVAAELGPGLDVLRRVKQVLDPRGILNPGVLLP